jgi:aldehyde dehydrogenase (NAD+)
MAAPTKPQTSQAPGHPYGAFDRQYIDGMWRHGAGKRTLKDENPFTGETLVEIPEATADDLDSAYQSAASAQPAWAGRTPGERSAVMLRAAQIIEQRREEIIGWIIRESGGTRIKATLECDAVHADFMEASGVPYETQGRILPSDVPGKECRVYRKPVGVVGVISPWNWPLQLTARSVAPALAVGNAVVLKPASDTPVTGGTLIAKILEEAGLPPGVLNVVIGAGSEIGDSFVLYPVPRVISFTGSTPVGRRIGRFAVESPIIKRTELELGGNSPFVVLADANLDQAVDAAVFGKFLHQGQICMITNRFVVEEPVYSEFLDRFVDRVKKLEVGDPEKPTTLIGPIINRKQLERLQGIIGDAEAEGAKKLTGGDPQGLVLPPHVFADVSNDQKIAREEIFGPVAPVIRARDEEEALTIANDTEYGLSSAVFTRDFERGLRFAQRVEAGMTHINDQPVNDLPNNPFGGEKNSGIGRFGGEWAVEAFTTDHWITIQHQRRTYPRDAREIGGPWGGG